MTEMVISHCHYENLQSSFVHQHTQKKYIEQKWALAVIFTGALCRYSVCTSHPEALGSNIGNGTPNVMPNYKSSIMLQTWYAAPIPILRLESSQFETKLGKLHSTNSCGAQTTNNTNSEAKKGERTIGKKINGFFFFLLPSPLFWSNNLKSKHWEVLGKSTICEKSGMFKNLAFNN